MGSMKIVQKLIFQSEIRTHTSMNLDLMVCYAEGRARRHGPWATQQNRSNVISSRREKASHTHTQEKKNEEETNPLGYRKPFLP